MRHKPNVKEMFSFIWRQWLPWLVLSFVFLSSFWVSPRSRFIWNDPDTYLHLWNFYHMRCVVTKSNEHVWYSKQVFYPTGIDLHYHALTPAKTWVGFFIDKLSTRVLWLNLWVLFSFAAAGWGMYRLARELGLDTYAAFISGVVFTFSGYHVQHIARLDVVTIEGFPFYLLALYRMRHDRRWRWPALAIAMFLYTALSCWYYAVYLSFLTAVFMVYYLTGKRTSFPYRWKCFKRLCYVTVIVALFLSPVMLPMLKLRSGNTYMKKSLALHQRLSLDLLSVVLPSAYHPVFGRAVRPFYANITSTEPVYSVGWMAILLLLVAVIFSRAKHKRFWCYTGMLFFLLALGPYLHINGLVRITGYPVPLPYILLYRVIPILQSARAVSRFWLPALLAVSLLAGMGYAVLHQRFLWWRFRFTLFCVIMVFLCFEYVFSLPVTPMPRVAGVFTLLKDNPGAVLNVPVTDYGTPIILTQTKHTLPIVAGPITHVPPSRWRFIAETPMINALYQPALQTPKYEKKLRPVALRALRQHGVRYLVIHRRLLRTWFHASAKTIKRLTAFVAHTLPVKPMYQDAQVIIYRLY